MNRAVRSACAKVAAPAPAEPFSDPALVAGIREGSQADFNRLYERYFQRVYTFAYIRVRNHADAEEIAQETFTAVFRSIDGYRGQSSLLSWLYGIAKNTVNNHLRRIKAREAWLERADPDLWATHAASAATPEEELSMRRYADAIHQRLDSVAEWQVEVFVLRHLEDLPIREIARRMARSNDAIRSCLYRVKRLLVEAGDPSFAVTMP
ncbi:MAG TPA: RNA polymerase sigma factor [Myxococcota bacterium]|nr:RNA polymerase sigma factor [Myxococcota bacterium]